MTTTYSYYQRLLLKAITSTFLIITISSANIQAQPVVSSADSTAHQAQVTHVEKLFYAGDFEEAIEEAKKVTTSAATLWGEESEQYGDGLDITGVVMHHAGKLTLARAYLEAGVEHAKKHQADRPIIAGMRLSNLGMLLKDVGELGQALNCLQEAFDIGETAWLEGPGDYSTVVHNLSILNSSLGQYDQALEYAYLSLSLAEEKFGKQHLKYAFRLANIANILSNTNKYEALAVYPQLLEALESGGHEEHLLYAIALRNIGRTYLSLDEYEQAIPYLVDARDRIVTKYSTAHPQYIRVMSSLAWAQFKAIDYVAADTNFAHAYTAYQEVKLDNSNRLLLLQRISSFHESQGEVANAAHYYLKLVGELNRIITFELGRLNEREQVAWMERITKAKDQVLSFVYRHPEEAALANAALDLSLQFKQLTLGYRQTLLAKMTQSEDTLLLRTYTAWQGAQKALGQALSLPLSQQPENIDTQLEEARVLEREMANLSYDFRALQADQIGWKDIQQTLPAKAIAVDYVRYNYVNEHLDWTDSIRYAAWLISSDGSVASFIPLFGEEAIGNIRRTRQLYASTGKGSASTWRQLVWEPLQKHLASAQSIYYAADGILHLVNIGAIPTDEEYTLADQYELFRLSTLKQLARSEGQETTTNKQALVFGGLRYDGQETKPLDHESATIVSSINNSFRDWTGIDWEYLQWTGEEANNTTRKLQGADWQVALYTGAEGTEEAFKSLEQAEQSPQLIHLATHAFYFGQPSVDEGDTGFEIAANPMMRSGLILSGGNTTWAGKTPAEGAEDGILTAFEVSQLSLQQTELVVLSACNTGQGSIIGNEGVFGLQRAFKSAGVKYMLMSLWSVDDRKTYEFMDHFYRLWQAEGQSIPNAYRATQQAMRKQYAKQFGPQAWAGFILVE